MKKLLRKYLIAILNFPGKLYLKCAVTKKDFTIISNDCYGGEIYKWLDLEYNTPFIGLMLMAPCYIKLLKRPQYYLEQPLRFIQKSAYEEMNLFRKEKGCYPLAVIEEIEIHFLHYYSEEEAANKWERRTKRINWNNLKVKFSMDKDYANEQSLAEFEALPYKSKLCVSKEKYHWAKTNIQVSDFELDATTTFRSSLKTVNLSGWLNAGSIHFSSKLQRALHRLLYLSLKK